MFHSYIITDIDYHNHDDEVTADISLLYRSINPEWTYKVGDNIEVEGVHYLIHSVVTYLTDHSLAIQELEARPTDIPFIKLVS